MKQVLKYAGYILLILVIGFFIWRFGFMIVWVLIAAVISFIGQPLVRFFDKIHVRKRHMPHALSTLLSLAIIVLVIFGLLAIFIPLIVNQAETISKIDVNQLNKNLQGPLQWIDEKLHTFGVVPDGQTIQDFVVTRVKSLVNLGNITDVFHKFFSTAGNVVVGFFSVLFIAFFFLKDENMFEKGLLLIVPEKHHSATSKVVADSKNLLRRYFIGVVLQLIGVMSIIALGLWILGVENALLIGFFGGMMNLIPYIGPIIGSAIGITLGITTTLAFGTFNELLPVLIKLCSVFIVANFIDNNILVPLIYSSSVKAHPLEIFFIIIIAGSLAGILGMLLAIPVYTVLRVIAREFFYKFRLVKKLTDTID
ncbi:MAG: AI-2E family transporter [Bacteroidales bacterium]|nr:AI-2E family transporter [Bacteroidales bacterium]